jgi:hypothetical protein
VYQCMRVEDKGMGGDRGRALVRGSGGKGLARDAPLGRSTTPQVMTKICREAEASLDYYAMFKNILKQAPIPMTPLESLASSAVRTAHKVRAAGGSPLGGE